VNPVSNAVFATPVTASDGIHDSDVTVDLISWVDIGDHSLEPVLVLRR